MACHFSLIFPFKQLKEVEDYKRKERELENKQAEKSNATAPAKKVASHNDALTGFSPYKHKHMGPFIPGEYGVDLVPQRPKLSSTCTV